MVKLNRIVALGKAKSSTHALTELVLLETNPQIQNHYLFYAIKGEFLVEAGKIKKGIKTIYKAISLTNNTAEQEYLKRKIEVLRK